jgi:hypothetical protein
MFLLAVGPRVAAAATYEVKLCTEHSGHEGITISPDTTAGPGTPGLLTEDECGIDKPGFEGITQKATGPAGSSVTGAVRWHLDAPEGTMIEKLLAIRESSGNWDPEMVWIASRTGAPAILDKVEARATTKDVEYTVNSTLFEASLLCAHAPCTPESSLGFLTVARLRKIAVKMQDTSAPTVTFDPAPGTAPVHATVQIPVHAKDKGAGITKVEFFVDGIQKGTVTDDNGGKCGTTPFKFLVPCKSELTPSLSLDTTQFPIDESHTVKAVVTDASGQTGEASVTIEVHNAPVSTQPPALSGTARLGQTLSATPGSWDGGTPPSFAFQWLRCEPAVIPGEETGCTLIPGAVQDHYAPGAADVGKRDVAKVTATNPFGSKSALSAPSGVVADSGGGQEEGHPAGAPQTKIIKHPRSKTSIRAAKFTFSSNLTGSSFQCKLDKGFFKTCRSPFKHKVKRGRHVFQVRAVNSAGLADPTPARFRWRVS